MGKMASMGDGFHLPEELMIEILVRLPVKSLLIFKCVCKQWCDLIQNPNFVTNHFNSPNKHTRLLVLHKSGDIITDYNSDSDSESHSGYNDNIQPDPDEEFVALIGFPDETLACQLPAHEYIADFIQVTPYRYKIIGPVNGLFLLQQYNMPLRRAAAALWNPATTEFRLLPDPVPTLKDSPFYTYGFGLDPITNYYKVICIPIISLARPQDQPSGPAMVPLYTLGSDSWRLIEAEASVFLPWIWLRVEFFFGSGAIYLNGANYWLFRSRIHPRIVKFDFGSEVFREVKSPDKANADDNFSHHLFLYNDDSIALFVMEFVSSRNLVLESIEMWVMKQGEEEGCWNKHFTLRLGPHLHLYKPLGFWKNDYDIFFAINPRQLVLYNTNTRNITDLGVRGESTTRFGIVLAVLNYKESLVSVGGQKASKRDKLLAMVQDFFARSKSRGMV